jgi:hypothetical protein
MQSDQRGTLPTTSKNPTTSSDVRSTVKPDPLWGAPAETLLCPRSYIFLLRRPAKRMAIAEMNDARKVGSPRSWEWFPRTISVIRSRFSMSTAMSVYTPTNGHQPLHALLNSNLLIQSGPSYCTNYSVIVPHQALPGVSRRCHGFIDVCNGSFFKEK